MSIEHHLDDATIVSLASGTLNPAIAVAASAHVKMCRQCEHALDTAQAVGGALLDDCDSVPMSASSVNNVLEKIEVEGRGKQPAAFPAKRKRQLHHEGDVVPPHVARLIGAPVSDLKWRRAGGGVSTYQIDLGKGETGKLFLMKIEAGRAMPEHGHGGSELTLVLSGSYHDKYGHFGRGDVADLDDDAEHQPIVDDGEDCICLVAVERPTRFKGLLPKVFQPFVGI